MRTLPILIGCCFIALAGAAADDLPIADFEGDTYGAWEATGEAFGPGPARGTLPGQMPVSGFQGSGLVNTFFRGDGTIGTLTSPPFRIERRYIRFLLGGGHDPERLLVDLLVEGNRVRTATGPNRQPGGSEALDTAVWDVGDLAGNRQRLIDWNRSERDSIGERRAVDQLEDQPASAG